MHETRCFRIPSKARVNGVLILGWLFFYMENTAKRIAAASVPKVAVVREEAPVKAAGVEE